jgi:hypothetical protein
MIGAAVEIAGGREMTPQAMARSLLFADPRPNVILAIDDAHTLSHPSLRYGALMSELLAPDAPILQIVLAAGPALLETLAQPEFERLRNRLCRPGFETFRTWPGGSVSAASAGLRKPARGGAPAGLAHFEHVDPPAAAPAGVGIARPAVYAAAGLVVAGCLAALGYIAFSGLTVDPTLPPVPPLGPAAEQLGAAGNGDQAALSPNAAAPAPPTAATDHNVDVAPPATPANAASAAADAAAVLSAEQPSTAGNGDRAGLSPNAAAPVPPSAAPDQNVAPPAIPANAAPAPADAPAALPAEQLGAAGNGDRAPLSLNAAAAAPTSAAPDQNVDVAPPATPVKAAPVAADAAAERAVAGLPTLAPVRVILNVPREDSARARRSADIERALAAAGLEVSGLVPVDGRQPAPSIGYYFQSDQHAAAEVSRLLEPLLGAVDPVVFRKRGSIPEPGTIEIAIP